MSAQLLFSMHPHVLDVFGVDHILDLKPGDNA